MTQATHDTFATIPGLKSLLSQTGWAILSAEVAGWGPSMNRLRTTRLGDFLYRQGIDAVRTIGTYGGVSEVSYLCVGISPEVAVATARLYHQESVLLPEGIVFCDGETETLTPTGIVIFAHDDPKGPNDNYTYAPEAGVVFSVQF